MKSLKEYKILFISSVIYGVFIQVLNSTKNSFYLTITGAVVYVYINIWYAKKINSTKKLLRLAPLMVSLTVLYYKIILNIYASLGL